MAGKMPSIGARSVDDDHARVQGIPVANVPEVWQVAHIHALNEVRKLLIGLHDAKALSPAEFKSRLRELIEHLNDRSLEYWDKFIELNSFHELHAESLRELGVPDLLYLEEGSGLCGVAWLDQGDGHEGAPWNPISIPLPGDAKRRQYPVTPAFRPIVLKKLPEGTVTVEVADTRHAAVVCIIDVLNVMIDDIRTVVRDAPDLAWKWVRKVSLFYRDQYELSKSKLVLDDYRDWVPELPSSLPLLEAPQIIGRRAGNARTVRTLSLSTAVACLEDAIDRAESEPYSTDGEERVSQVVHDLEVARDKLRPELEIHNGRVLVEARARLPESELYVISRPIPGGPPVLALLPRERMGVVSSFQAPLIGTDDPADPQAS